MDQLKEILRQAIKYRFWITAGLSILFPLVAYYSAIGSIQDKTRFEKDSVKSANNKINPYKTGSPPTARYAAVLNAKTEELAKVVSATHRDLYARQAPIFTWPEGFEDRFPKWGRKWPENVAGSEIEQAIRDYVDAYPEYVRSVYQTVRPWDPKTGKGVVVTRPIETLLFPAQFTVDEPPTLKQIWDAQEKIWLQHALLEVVDSVNKKATNWDEATIKQLSAIDVGVEAAMDQTWGVKKDAEREKLKTTPPILPGNAPPPEEKTEKVGDKDPMEALMKGNGGSSSDSSEVAFIEPSGGQYRLYPIYLSVTMDQSRINDLFHALRNSPMAIQIKEVEISRPEERVKRPEKGKETALGASVDLPGAGGSDLNRYSGMANRRGGSRDAMKNYAAQMSQELQGMGGSTGGMFGDLAKSSTPSTGGLDASREKIDLREVNRTGKKKVEPKAKSQPAKVETIDPYYYLIDVRINGFARFYNPPAPPATGTGETLSQSPAEAAESQPQTAANPETQPVDKDDPKAKTSSAESKTDLSVKTDAPSSTDKTTPADSNSSKPAGAESSDASTKDDSPEKSPSDGSSKPDLKKEDPKPSAKDSSKSDDSRDIPKK